MAGVYRKCFICSLEIKKPYFLSVNESSFMFYEILGISNWCNDLQRIKFEKVCYCHECSNRIINIRDMLQELKQLEKEILHQKYKIKSELRESCTKSEKNFVIDEDGQQQQQTPGMLQIFREEIVSKFVNISTEPTLRQVKIEEEAEEYQRCISSNNIQNVNYINWMPREESLGHILQSTTSENKEFNSNHEDTLEDIYKNTIKPCRKSGIDKSKTPTTSNSDPGISNYVSRNPNKYTVKPKKSKIKNETINFSSQDVNLKLVHSKFKIPPSLSPKKCEECGKVLSKRSTYKEHMIRFHGAQGSYKCKLCTYSTSFPSHLIQHMITHSADKNFRCEICFKTFKIEKYLLFHKTTHHAGKFQCMMCLIKFDDVKSLVRHELIEHAGKLTDFKCGICTMTFKTENVLRSHILVHKNKFQCKVCLIRFNNSRSLVKHENQLHVKKNDFKCDFCFKTFKLYKYLYQHRRAVHVGKFKCKVCLNTFMYMSGLRKHEIEAHGVEC